MVPFAEVGRRVSSLLLAASVTGAFFAGACGATPGSARLLVSAGAPARPIEMPGPARARLASAVAANAECERCHRDIANEWETSLHHRADVEPAYERSFAIEPLPFCRGCHAPESVATEEEPASVRDLGVGCVTCHVTDEGAGSIGAFGGPTTRVLAAPRPGPEPRDHGPHEVVRDPRFADEGACSGCHEFAFPLATPRTGAELGRTDLMQSTVLEHAESPGKSLSCANCHMPPDDGHKRSHAFVTSRDASVVRRAVRIDVDRVDATHVRVKLAPNELGHAFPTGDLFRRIAISANVIGPAPEERVLGSAVRFLARHFAAPSGLIGRVLVSDDRVGGSGAEVTLDVGEAGRGNDIFWRVDYQRVAHPNGIDETNATLEGELTLASGRLRALPGGR